MLNIFNTTEEVDLTQVTKEKFGITFHKNMSIGDMAKKWVKEASSEIKDKYPELNIIFNAANGQVQIEKGLRTAQITADTTYKTVKGAIEDASAILTGQMQQPIAKATAMSTKIAEEAQVFALNTVKNKAIDLLLSAV